MSIERCRICSAPIDTDRDDQCYTEESGVLCADCRSEREPGETSGNTDDDPLFRENERDYDGAPYCSYGHRTKAQCDCGPIASND